MSSITPKRTRSQVSLLGNNVESKTPKRVRESLSESPSLNITEINDDCLEFIFEYLPMHDLINLAESCKRLRQSAVTVFGRKHETKTLDVSLDDFGLKRTHWSMLYRQMHIAGSTIKAVMPGPVLKLLRIFGQHITKINMTAGCRCVQIHKRIYGYINKYCSNTLKSITVLHEVEIGSAGTRKSMKGVEVVNINMSELEIIDYRKLFPNVRRFCLSYAKFVDRKRFTTKYEKLEDFEIDYCYTGKMFLGKNDVKQIIRLNPSLRRFALTSDCEPYIWQCLRKWSPKLEELNVRYNFSDILLYKGDLIHFENVNKLVMTVNINDDLYEQNPKKDIILAFDKVKECNIFGRFKRFWIQFITENSSIEKLHIEHSDNDKFTVNNNDITSITKWLPKINEFSMKNCHCSLEDIIKLLYGCTTINKFSWILDTENNSTRADIENTLCELSTSVAPEWNSTMEDGNSIVLERKI